MRLDGDARISAEVVISEGVGERYVLANQLRVRTWAQEPASMNRVGTFLWAFQSNRQWPRTRDSWVQVATVVPLEPESGVDRGRHVAEEAFIRLLNVVGVPRAVEGREHAYWKGITDYLCDESARFRTWPQVRWFVDGDEVTAHVVDTAGCHVGLAELPVGTFIAVIGRHLRLENAEFVPTGDFGTPPRILLGRSGPPRPKEPLPSPIDDIVRGI